MKPPEIRVAKNTLEIHEMLSRILLSAPKFIDRTGYFPYWNLDYAFRELNAGLEHNRSRLGEQRYQTLMAMSDRVRALFEADPEDKTGDTLKGCMIIHEMLDILRQARRKSR
jgi:hypothetical protein